MRAIVATPLQRKATAALNLTFKPMLLAFASLQGQLPTRRGAPLGDAVIRQGHYYKAREYSYVAWPPRGASEQA